MRYGRLLPRCYEYALLIVIQQYGNVSLYSGAAGMVPDPQGGSAEEGEPSQRQGGWTVLDCLNCQGAEQTLGGSPSVLCGGMAALSHASKLCRSVGTFALQICLGFSEKCSVRFIWGFGQMLLLDRLALAWNEQADGQIFGSRFAQTLCSATRISL